MSIFIVVICMFWLLSLIFHLSWTVESAVLQGERPELPSDTAPELVAFVPRHVFDVSECV
jgi:hypothetical protein